MTPAFFHPHVGGVETHCYNLSSGLARRGYDVHIVTSRTPRDAPRYDEVAGVKVTRLPSMATVYNAPLLRGLGVTLKAMKPDLIHTHLPSPYVANVSAAVGALQKIPTVLTYHNDIVGPGRIYSLMAGGYNRFFGRLLLDSVDKIITTTRGYANTSGHLAPFLDKVIPIRNGVDTDFFHPGNSGEEVVERFGEQIVLFVGSLAHTHSYKGVDYLIFAAPAIRRACPGARILVVGDGPLRPTLMEMARRSGVQDMVHFPGFLSREELRQYYAAATLCILPSTTRAEGFGLVLLEAMASGKPVVGTDVGGIPYFVHPGENGILIPPRDPRAITKAIIDILGNRELALRMGLQGRALVEREFSWLKMVDKTEAVYRDLLGPT